MPFVRLFSMHGGMYTKTTPPSNGNVAKPLDCYRAMFSLIPTSVNKPGINTIGNRICHATLTLLCFTIQKSNATLYLNSSALNSFSTTILHQLNIQSINITYPHPPFPSNKIKQNISETQSWPKKNNQQPTECRICYSKEAQPEKISVH